MCNVPSRPILKKIFAHCCYFEPLILACFLCRSHIYLRVLGCLAAAGPLSSARRRKTREFGICWWIAFTAEEKRMQLQQNRSIKKQVLSLLVQYSDTYLHCKNRRKLFFKMQNGKCRRHIPSPWSRFWFSDRRSWVHLALPKSDTFNGKQKCVLCVLTPQFLTKIYYCCSFHVFYSIKRAGWIKLRAYIL